MLILFRKLRNTMLKQNKVSTYLLYAIGEIILVVVGILIAIQIDQWHKANQDDKKVIALLKTYTNDLHKDVEALTINLEEQNEKISKGENILNRLNGEHVNFDTVKNIAQFEHDAILSSISGFHKNTFNSMINSGTIELVGNEIKNKMMELDRMQIRALSGNLIELYTTAVSSYMQKYPFGDDFGKHYLHKTAWDIPNKRAFVVEYRQMSHLRMVFIKNSNSVQKEVLSKTKELIKLINETKPK